MKEINKFKKCYPVSYEIVECYTKMLGLLGKSERFEVKYLAMIAVINKLSKIEMNRYNKLDKETTEKILKELGEIPGDKLSVSDIRVISRLKNRYDLFSDKYLVK